MQVKNIQTYSPNEEVCTVIETFCKLASESASHNPLQSQFKLLFREYGVTENIEQNTFSAIIGQTSKTSFSANQYWENEESIIPNVTTTDSV